MLKPYSILLFIYLLSCSNFYAFTIVQDSTEFSNKSITGMTKMVYAYMKDYEETLNKYGSVGVSEGERNGMERYNKRFLNNSSVQNINLDSLENFLELKKNSWSSNGLKVFQSLREKYKDQLDNKNYNLETVFLIEEDIKKIYLKDLNERKIENLNWENTLTDILGYTPKKNKLYTNENAIQEPIKTDINLEKQQPKVNNILKYLSFLISFVLGGLLVFWFYNKRIKRLLRIEYDHYKNEIKNNDKKYPSFGLGVIQFLIERKNKYKGESELNSSENLNYPLNNEIRSLIDKNKHLEKRYFDLKDKLSHGNAYSSKDNDSISSDALSKKDSAEKSSTLYYSVPERDGCFLDENSTSSPVVRSYFKISFNESEQKGKLYYRGGNLDASAISQMDLILGPVCEIDNISNREANAINIVSNGTVTRADGRWIVQKKIQLKFR